MRRYGLSLFALGFFAAFAHSQLPSPLPSPAADPAPMEPIPTNAARFGNDRVGTYARLPMSFEPNNGQMNSHLQFGARGEGYSLSLTEGKAVLALTAQRTMSSATVPATSAAPARDQVASCRAEFVSSVETRA